ncbi:hypothetical protein PUV54_07525 [Hyphococcus flavus]|uniref:Uncharacterized protein n=1 Tax=Hyphococcus flavus TaxID=1866326 RepID=A0AAF0CH49_9PROT|nr:hypothetical protein [Hyphococcus flavus]WDI33043.1 hypothetical protein PUV54_07525 [Hyphococcus flavus]
MMKFFRSKTSRCKMPEQRSLIVTPAPDQKNRGKNEKSLVETPSVIPNINPAAIEKRALKAGKKIAKTKLIALIIGLFGVVAPYEIIALSLLCGVPIIVTLAAFIRSRLDRDKWAGLVGKGAVAMLVCAVLVVLRGMYVSSDPVAKAGALAGQVITGVPSAVWAGVFTGRVPNIPLLHLATAIALTLLAIVVFYLQLNNAHLSRPAKPKDYYRAQARRPRRAKQIPNRIVN